MSNKNRYNVYNNNNNRYSRSDCVLASLLVNFHDSNARIHTNETDGKHDHQKRYTYCIMFIDFSAYNYAESKWIRRLLLRHIRTAKLAGIIWHRCYSLVCHRLAREDSPINANRGLLLSCGKLWFRLIKIANKVFGTCHTMKHVLE